MIYDLLDFALVLVGALLLVLFWLGLAWSLGCLLFVAAHAVGALH